MNRQQEVVAKPLHPEAANLASEYVQNYATSVILQAKVLAHARRDDMVLRRHVEDAGYALRRQEEQRSWSKQFLQLLGGALFGGGTSGFIREAVAPQPNMSLVMAFVAIAFLGLIVAAWQMRR